MCYRTTYRKGVWIFLRAMAWLNIYFSLIGKMFDAKIGLYALHNTGFFYYLGYLLGLGVLGGGGTASSRNRY